MKNLYGRCRNCGKFQEPDGLCGTCGGIVDSGSFVTHPSGVEFAPIPTPSPVMTAINHQLTLTREQWRWWFAGMVLKDLTGWETREEFAADAVKYADALLAELEMTAP